jgi:hypothetical protein
MDKVFTMKQIDAAWIEYKKSVGWRILKDGKWSYVGEAPDLSGGVTRAEMVKTETEMTFPKYLEGYNA